MSTFIHKINIWDWVNNIIVCIWMQVMRGQGGDVCEGSGGDSCNGKSLHILDLQIFKTGFKRQCMATNNNVQSSKKPWGRKVEG